MIRKSYRFSQKKVADSGEINFSENPLCDAIELKEQLGSEEYEKIIKSICRLEVKNELKEEMKTKKGPKVEKREKILKGTGFFLSITLEGESFIALVTTEHILRAKMINRVSEYSFDLFYISKIEENENEVKKVTININQKEKKRKVYTLSEKYENITIIELRKDDGIPLDSSLEVDHLYNKEGIIEEDEEGAQIRKYQGKWAYLLGYADEEKLLYADTEIKIKCDYYFHHKASTLSGLSGSPIIDKKTLKVIGVHTDGDTNKNINYATSIGEVIEYLSSKETAIECWYRAIPGKKIKLFDTKEFKGFNKSNTKIYINEEKVDFTSEYQFEDNNEENEENLMILICNEELESLAYMFLECEDLVYVDISEIKTKKIKDTSKMFYNCYNLSEIILPKNNFVELSNMEGMFEGCWGLTDIDLLYNINTREVKNMSKMFSCCFQLTDLDLLYFNTSNVTDLSLMFNGCSNLSEINLSSFDTKNVTSMEQMFCKCSSLKRINLCSFDTSNTKNISGMFQECKSLNEINLSSFKTDKVEKMINLFMSCGSINKIDLSNFITNEVNDMSFMFYGCSKLKEINLASFSIKSDSVGFHRVIFGCNNLTTIDLSKSNDLIIEKFKKEVEEGKLNVTIIDSKNK